MMNNEDLQKDVQNTLKLEPLLKTAEITITVKEGVVTLSGTVDNYAKKMRAEEVVKFVSGVVTVVENIQVELEHFNEKSDNEIANEVINAFKWHWDIPHHNISIKVENGWVFLEGKIEWNYQKQAAKNAIINVIGIKGISNNILITPKSKNRINIKSIESALLHHITIEHNNIKVTGSGQKVILKGTVDSWHHKEEATRIVWSAPGVLEVDNQLKIVSIE